MGKLAGYKTYIVAGVTIIGAIASYLIGDATLNDTAQLIVPAILGITIRHGITTETNK